MDTILTKNPKELDARVVQKSERVSKKSAISTKKEEHQVARLPMCSFNWAALSALEPRDNPLVDGFNNMDLFYPFL